MLYLARTLPGGCIYLFGQLLEGKKKERKNIKKKKNNDRLHYLV